MNILFFGPPGAGKGTQSALLVERTNRRHISTGNLFRSAIKNQTKLGVLVQGFLDKGELVPDQVTIDMVKEVLKTIDGDSFVLDGFPRTVKQAIALKMHLKDLDLSIGKALFLDISYELLISRLSGRRVCESCGENYHIQDKTPKKDRVCDSCGGEIAQRLDDQEEAIRHRLEIYEKSTSPLKKYYEQEGLLASIDGSGSTDEVFKKIQNYLEDPMVMVKKKTYEPVEVYKR